MVFGYEYEGELLISATWNALWTAMTSLGMLIGEILPSLGEFIVVPLLTSFKAVSSVAGCQIDTGDD
jgi:hypothetical protein